MVAAAAAAAMTHCGDARMITILIWPEPAVTLSELPLHRTAIVKSVVDAHAGDTIARRLRELGFVPGEQVVPLARGPIGGEPVLIQVGYTRFALRLAEAARVQVEVAA